MAASKKTTGPAKDWNAVIVARGGTVSLLKDMTEDQARKVAQLYDCDRDPWPSNIRRSAEESVFGKHDGSRFGGSWFPLSYEWSLPAKFWRTGHDGERLEVWPKPLDYDDKLSEAIAAIHEQIANGTYEVAWDDVAKENVAVAGFFICGTQIYRLDGMAEDVRAKVSELCDAAGVKPKSRSWLRAIFGGSD